MADQKRKMSERSELFSFPVLSRLAVGTRRAASCGRLLWLTFLGEARKVSGRRATPGQVAKHVVVLHKVKLRAFFSTGAENILGAVYF